MKHRSLLPSLALSIPALVWLTAAAALLIAVPGGYRVFAAPADLTLAEAAALGDRAEVLRLIGEGVDPNMAARVRGGMIGNDDVALTPLAAAVAVGRVDVVELLMRHDAGLHPADIPGLLCLAEKAEKDDVMAFLKEREPAAVADCAGVVLPW